MGIFFFNALSIYLQLKIPSKTSKPYEIGNPESGLGQAQKCVGFKPFNGIQNLYY
jgi:hypothetical protein